MKKFWKIIGFSLASLIFIVSTFPVSTIAVTTVGKSNVIPTNDQATFKTILDIPIGNGDQEVGYSAKAENVANDGPASFTIYKEKIYLLDTLNKKILVYNNAIREHNIDIGFCSYPRDITVNNKIIYLLDSNNLIYSINEEGLIQKIFKLPEGIESHQIKKIEVEEKGSVYVIDYNDCEYKIMSDNYKVNKDTSINMINGNKSIEILRDNKKFITLNFIEKTGGANIIEKNKSGYMYIELIDEVPDSSLVLVESTIRIINPVGEQIAIARIPLEEYYNIPLKFFDVSDNGEIYIMELRETRVIIKKIEMGTQYQSKMDELKEKGKSALENDLSSVNITDNVNKTGVSLRSDPGIPTRTYVRNRANAIIGYSWVYNYSNSINPDPANITKPSYLVSVAFPFSTIGIPYCWGGFDSIDRSSAPSSWSSFIDAMNKGKFAGNIKGAGNWKANTAGLDCSGFASAAYDFTIKYGTSSFATMGAPAVTLLSMDYYVKSGSHILLFNSWQSSSTINSKESTTAGYDKTINYTRTITWLAANNYSKRTLWI